ncbi:LacI family DNA-binding transcriptional regulator [Flavitalea sp.]|nr:substrate-binding domain-containing protein [Flavitalea sp.]
MPIKKKTSLKDIATAVGVSTALVSYVLNNKKEGRIRKEVAEKIRAMALKLNYKPNQIAKSLKTNKTNTIGLIVADISNPFSSSLARIIEDEAHRQGYTVIFGSSDEKPERCENLIETLVNRQVDGLIIFPPADSAGQIIQLKKQQIPFVLVDRYFPEIETNQVTLDNYEATFDAIQHLVDAGRRKIGMITYRTSMVHLNDRIRGYWTALKTAEIKPLKNWLKQVKINNDPKEIRAAVDELLSRGIAVDSILFASNRIAAIALKYIDELGIKVPETLAIVGFDETEIFDFFRVPITYVRQPLMEIGQTATRILLDNINSNKKCEQVRLSAKLVIRKSSDQERYEL